MLLLVQSIILKCTYLFSNMIFRGHLLVFLLLSQEEAIIHTGPAVTVGCASGGWDNWNITTNTVLEDTTPSSAGNLSWSFYLSSSHSEVFSWWKGKERTSHLLSVVSLVWVPRAELPGQAVHHRGLHSSSWSTRRWGSAFPRVSQFIITHFTLLQGQGQ